MRFFRSVIGLSKGILGVATGVAGSGAQIALKTGAVLVQPVSLIVIAGAVGTIMYKVHRAGLDPASGGEMLAGMLNRSERREAGIGLHLLAVYQIAKAETGLVDPSISEIKVAERRLDRIMREYEEFEFLPSHRSRYQTELAVLVVTPSADQTRGLEMLNKSGIAKPLDGSRQYHAGSGWGRPVSLRDLVFRRCTLREYATRGHFSPQRK
jgi:hypothetical protein